MGSLNLNYLHIESPDSTNGYGFFLDGICEELDPCPFHWLFTMSGRGTVERDRCAFLGVGFYSWSCGVLIKRRAEGMSPSVFFF